MQNPPRLQMRQITKHFGGVHALQDVSFDARAGEVHAICGENGAGKSTLMKILAGAITEFDGTITLDNQIVRFQGPRDAEELGIRTIYQELNLVPDLSVAANMFLGRERRATFGLIDNRAMETEALRVFQRLGTPINPRARVGDLRIGDQQMVEIAKALAFEAQIVIMDEPTSALSDAEVARLFRVIADLRANGSTVLYISHKMNEVFNLADRVSVLRDGRNVATAEARDTSPAQVVRWMVGRDIPQTTHQTPDSNQTPLLEVRGMRLPRPVGTSRPALTDIEFTLAQGEILGVAGLLGSGRTELLEALFGASAIEPSGQINLAGKPLRARSPSHAIAAGIALVTEDRKNLGLFNEMNVRENISLVRLGALARRGGFVRQNAERTAVQDEIQRLAIKTAGPSAPITSLSGGNQQKCIVARWLLTNPRLLLLDEPTRGIDVGAKMEIYALMRKLAREGMGIIMTSSELPELLAVCDRILVLCEGRQTALLPRHDANEEAIMHAATAFLDRGLAAG